MEAEVELNANIRNLQLGCGGVNGAGACDVDIKNLSLSGATNLQSSVAGQEGSPIFTDNTRAGTSAVLTNPFIELAIKNPHSAATRELLGFRLSAEAIDGLLTAGLGNNATPTAIDGIQRLSGFLQLAPLAGEVTTQATKFGKQDPLVGPIDNPDSQIIAGKVNVDLTLGQFKRGFRSEPADGRTTGITIPSMTGVEFAKNSITLINGRRNTTADVTGINVALDVPLAKPTGCSDAGLASAGISATCGTWDNDALYVTLTSHGDPKYSGQNKILGIVGGASFKMAEGSKLTGLNVDVTFKQALSMIHNIPLKGTGGYLSLQAQDIHWPGANSADIAQRGWWLSLAEPVDLGRLQGNVPADISSVLPQVAKLVTQQLLDTPDIYVSTGEGLGAVFNTPISKTLEIGLAGYTASNPAKITLENLQLKNQTPPTNCWGNLKFC